jgi:hypothetical protein
MTPTQSEQTVAIAGEERDVSDLIFVSLVGKGLVIQHQSWAEEKLQGTGAVQPDPMDFGDDEAYAPRTAVEARELLDHPMRRGGQADEDWFALYDEQEAEDVEGPESFEDLPDGYAKVDGELVTIDELLEARAGEDGDSTAGGEPPTAAESDGEGTGEGGRAPTGRPRSALTPLTAPEGETITTKQGAIEALAAEGVDFSADGAPTPSSKKEAIVTFAHEAGYRFPNYE